jgi:hypothetical protein
LDQIGLDRFRENSARADWSLAVAGRIDGREVTAVNLQTANKSGIANNFWLQTAVLVIVVAGLIAIAAKYIW